MARRSDRASSAGSSRLRSSGATRMATPRHSRSSATTNFAGDPQMLDALFNRMEFIFESVDGHFTEISRDLGRQVDLDIGPIHPFDETLNAWSPAAHVDDDLFQNKIAFVVLLNFPLTTLEQRLAEGDQWTRRQW